jgi:hypothetical protein
LGAQAHAGWQPVESGCGTDPEVYPQNCHASLIGAGLALDHDPFDDQGLVLRYGLGVTVFASGGAGVVLPFSFGLRWQW